MQVLMPESLDEAVGLKRDRPDLVPMAGATDLLVHWPVRPLAHEADYLDLSGLDDLRGIRWTDHEVELGALATYWDVIRDERIGRELPILADAARTVGAIQIQSRGTWAGNIANASPAADGVPALMACGAVVALASGAGRRDVPLTSFYHGYKQTEMRDDELITSIRVPRRAYAMQRFEKIGTRRAQAIAKIGLAVTRSEAGWRVVVASMAPTVCRCANIERRLRSGEPVGSPDDLLSAIDADLAPIDDVRSTAAYRRRVLSRVLHSIIGEEP